MSILADKQIRNFVESDSWTFNPKPPFLGIEPFDGDSVRPSSYDLHLGNSFQVFDHPEDDCVIDLGIDFDPPKMREIIVPEDKRFIFRPGTFALACTSECIRLPSIITAALEGVSSLARLGILVHLTGGRCDPGFEGTITLEILNVSPITYKLKPGMRFGQIVFDLMDLPAERPYNHPDLKSKYMGQSGATPSRYSQELAEI